MHSNFPVTGIQPPAIQSTTLHAGRIFAVAPSVFPHKLTLAGVLASRLGRLCSHPSDCPCGRYPLPFELNHACPDFPPELSLRRLLSAGKHYTTFSTFCIVEILLRTFAA